MNKKKIVLSIKKILQLELTTYQKKEDNMII